MTKKIIHCDSTFVNTLPVRLIPGVGKVTAEKLERLGVQNCEHARTMEAVELSKHCGRLD